MGKTLLSTRTKKKTRTTRTEGYLINLKYLGGEPSPDSTPLTGVNLSRCLTWYNYMCTTSDAREYLENYVASINNKFLYKALKGANDAAVPLTAAWLARMHMNGFALKEENLLYIKNKLNELAAREKKNKVPEDDAETKNVVSIQKRMHERSMDIIGDIEEMIDKNQPFSLYDWLKAKEIPPTYCNDIILHYSYWLDELLEAFEGKDEQLKEAYRYLTKKKLKEQIVFFNTLIEDANRYSSNTKKVNATVKKPKTVSAEKKLKNLKYQSEDKNYKVASVNPQKIIGAQELITFNTKSKLLNIIRAIDIRGLDIKGSSIVNYDETTSIAKRIGRNTEQTLSSVLKSNKTQLKKLLSELKVAAELNPRVNDSTILLKVY